MSFLAATWETFAHAFLPRTSNNQRSRILHPAGLSILVAIFLLNNALRSVINTIPGFVLGFSSSVTVEEIIVMTNAERAKAHLPPLSQNALLTQAAVAKAADMFASDYWAHISPSGTQPWDFVKNVGYKYQYAGENLARDFSDSENLMHAWMASTSHRDNVLSSKYQDIGVAIVDGTLQGVETRLVVQLLGSPAPIPIAQVQAQTEAMTGEVKQTKTLPPAEIKEVVSTAPNIEIKPQFAGTSMSQTAAQSIGKEKKISPTQITQAFGMILITLILLTLLVDWAIAHKRKTVRLVGKNWAHLTFLGAAALMLLQFAQGRIL